MMCVLGCFPSVISPLISKIFPGGQIDVNGNSVQRMRLTSQCFLGREYRMLILVIVVVVVDLG